MNNTAVDKSQAKSLRNNKEVKMKEESNYSDGIYEEELEVEEIVEIIEEIEEVVEEEAEEADDKEESSKDVGKTREIVRRNETNSKPSGAFKNRKEEDKKDHGSRDAYRNVKFSKQRREYFSRERNSGSGVVAYDAHQDWEDEENDQQATTAVCGKKNGFAEKSNGAKGSLTQKMQTTSYKRSASSKDNHYSPADRSNAEPAYKVAKTRASTEYIDVQSIANSLEMDEEDGEEEESQHEIVKSVDNNLVYTVLGTRKSSSASAKANRDNTANRNLETARRMKIEQLDDESIPIEGTIYYEGDNIETVYVAHSINNDSDQYQCIEQVMVGEGEEGWEAANEEMGENQEEEEEEADEGNEEEGQEDEAAQDQIFLHEDEDGQLYFKDESGTLQPVYLTADGNYAICENSNDEQEIQDNENNDEESSAAVEQAEELKEFDDNNFIVPELDCATGASNSHDPDNEENTVTISLIISEDENGQKRTQVIIPTADNLKCEICSKSFKTSFQLLRHNRLKHAREEDITTRSFPCDMCPKRYSDQNTLARHRKTHIGDRPFGCLECGKSFPTSTALRRHLTQHNPQSRPLPCIYCGRRFLEKSALTKHEQSHLAGDQRTHTCDICHKSFLQAADLNLHKKNHDPDKKFDCEVCGREFNRLNNLQRHMMVHKQKQDGNQEILACDVCGITYKFMSSLTRHMVTSHMNPEKLRQQADEQRKKREHNYRRYLENRKMYETQHAGPDYSASVGNSSNKRSSNYRSSNDIDEDSA